MILGLYEFYLLARRKTSTDAGAGYIGGAAPVLFFFGHPRPYTKANWSPNYPNNLLLLTVVLWSLQLTRRAL